MPRSDLDRPVFRQRYPTAVLIETKSGKARGQVYLIEDGAKRLYVRVTGPGSDANRAELAAITAVSRLGIPVPEAICSFHDDVCSYLVLSCVDGIPIEDGLKDADEAESFRLGEIMGDLLQRIHSMPVEELEELPRPSYDWWRWIGNHLNELPSSDLPMALEPTMAFVHNDFVPHNILIKRDHLEVAALIDFEWSFVGDPDWDVGHLRSWLNTGEYANPDDCWHGVLNTYLRPFNDYAATLYASVRDPESKELWEGSLPPPISWLRNDAAEH